MLIKRVSLAFWRHRDFLFFFRQFTLDSALWINWDYAKDPSRTLISLISLSSELFLHRLCPYCISLYSLPSGTKGLCKHFRKIRFPYLGQDNAKRCLARPMEHFLLMFSTRGVSSHSLQTCKYIPERNAA